MLQSVWEIITDQYTVRIIELLRSNPSGNWVIQISVDKNLVPEYFKQYHILFYIFQGL